jgi:hypothetical protein
MQKSSRKESMYCLDTEVIFERTESRDLEPNYSISISMSEARAQGDPCIVTIFWSIMRSHLLYSANSPVPLTKYSILLVAVTG